MLNNSIKILLLAIFALLMSVPSPCFAWVSNGDGYWDYHGSGRDYPYSYYIDEKYTIGYADYSRVTPDYIDEAAYIKPVPTAVPVSQPEVFVVNIPNKKSGYTAVVIKRTGNGFTGPQGEYYPEFPKVFQLEIMYGK